MGTTTTKFCDVCRTAESEKCIIADESSKLEGKIVFREHSISLDVTLFLGSATQSFDICERCFATVLRRAASDIHPRSTRERKPKSESKAKAAKTKKAE